MSGNDLPPPAGEFPLRAVWLAASRRLPRSERELRLFSAFLLWLSPTVTVVAASFVPALAPHDVNFWRLTLGVPAATIAFAHLLVFPRFQPRTQDRLLIASSTLGALVNVPLLCITRATWAIEMNALAAVIWAGYFLGRRGIVWIAGVVTAIVASPLVIHYPGAGPTDGSRLTVYIPVIWAIALALSVQKRNVDDALEHVHRLAYRDPLTRLSNRHGLIERFDELVAGGDRFSLLLIDLDNFKIANTIYGHLGGDHALRVVAYHLRRAAGRGHLVARIGGDEFVALLPGVDGDSLREQTALYRSVVIAADHELDLPGVGLDASVGSASFPDHGNTLDDLLTEADRSMYREKATHVRATTSRAAPSDRVPSWLGIAPAEETNFRPLTPLRRFWRHRPLFARFSAMFAIVASLTTIVSLYVPGAPVDGTRPAVLVCVAGVFAGVVLLIAAPRHRGPTHRVIDFVGLIGLAVFARLTGGATSPVLPLVLLFAVYQAWFWSVRSAGWRLLGPLLVCLSPLLYDPAFSHRGWEIAACTLYSTYAMVAILIASLGVNTAVLLGIRRHSRELALTDSLTGLPNRRAFAERVEAELDDVPNDAQDQLALVMIDMDNFKDVNTLLGHHGGDRLLQEIGNALAVAARSSDCVARVGGDEFAAVLPAAGVDGARRLAERFVAAVSIASEPVARETGVHVTASAGFALHPLHGKTLDDLMRAADDALMSVKRDGKAGTRVSNVVVGI